MNTIPLPCVEHATGPAPVASLIVLHGLGADGHDFEPLVQELDLSAVGPVRFVLPHAPERPVTLNGGMTMPAWYDITSLAFGQRKEDASGLRASQAAVERLLDRERERGVPAERIVLAGFSQGCAMALLTGLRYPQRLAGIAGLSGYLPLAAATAAERHAANAQTPVFLAHGRFDEVVPPAAGTAARDTLQALGQPVHWRDYPMGHEVCAPELADLQAWLLQRLAPA